MMFQPLTTKPPTIYSILESLVNYGRAEKIQIKDLAKYGRSRIFDFEYPLSSKINREDFETQILNHYMMRRIGFETVVVFSLQLSSKLNEIMPEYNKLFDMLEGWDIFEDGDVTKRIVEDTRNINVTGNTKTDTQNIMANDVTNTSNSTQTLDNRHSDTPQDELDNIRAGSYVTDYTYNTNNNQDNGTSIQNSNNTGSSNTDNTNETINVGKLTETTSHSPADKMRLYSEFIENRAHIYSLLYRELDCLFYGLV